MNLWDKILLHSERRVNPHSFATWFRPTRLERAEEDKREGKSPSTQAGEFVREEMDHIREGKHGARSTKQAIAIGLSKARRAGVELPPPKEGTASSETRQKAARDVRRGKSRRKPSTTRARARGR